ncbi:PD-(D/E)XK nuclease family protein [Spiroplasma endosymbiont of Tricholauxania praeusta]|uniref:PD-(D/E)XK nuclease family protein n=1 Tax=Spiroplasma endosymbiont of Tricholauxania praeusta TaxID=3066296 RepID=UPI0030D0B1D5
MQLNNQKNNLIFKKETHQYFIKNKELISVSKILDYYLGNSYCKCNKCKYCFNIHNARIRGNAVHKVAELYFQNINIKNITNQIKNYIKDLFPKNYLNYCYTLLEYLPTKFINNNEYISEKMFNADIVAGTPDLIYKENNLNIIVDFKTYKVFTKELLEKSKLQIIAYYWLLKNNNYELSNIHFICWVKENEIELIKVEITNELLMEWEKAIWTWKELK